MKSIIIYESTHHGNTKKLVDAISTKYGVETVSIENAAKIDFSTYDMIGIASGIAFGKFYKATEDFALNVLPVSKGKKVFLMYTSGSENGNREKFAAHIACTLENKGYEIAGVYGCLGYDTFGPFKLVGGIAKGHPTQKEIDDAVIFYGNIQGKE